MCLCLSACLCVCVCVYTYFHSGPEAIHIHFTVKYNEGLAAAHEIIPIWGQHNRKSLSTFRLKGTMLHDYESCLTSERISDHCNSTLWLRDESSKLSQPQLNSERSYSTVTPQQDLDEPLYVFWLALSPFTISAYFSLQQPEGSTEEIRQRGVSERSVLTRHCMGSYRDGQCKESVSEKSGVDRLHSNGCAGGWKHVSAAAVSTAPHITVHKKENIYNAQTSAHDLSGGE